MDDYVAVLPFYKKRKWLIPYIVPPLLCQRLKVLGVVTDAERNLLYERLLKQGIQVTVSSDDPVPQGCTFHNRVNHVLTLTDSYYEISKIYNRNTRRNLEEFLKSGQTLEQSYVVADCCRFLAKHDKTGLILRYRHNFETLIKTSLQLGCGHILVSRSEGEVVSVAFYIEWQGRIYFLLCASDSSGKNAQATYAIIDAIIQKYAGSGFIFDFTGSGIPGVARRNEGFGAETESYWQMQTLLMQQLVLF
jgi:hypothetical protein